MPQLKIFVSAENRITFELGDERVTIGRLAHNLLQIDEPSVSSHHAEIFFKAGRYHLQDSASTNGTFVNGERVTNAMLRSGDDLRFEPLKEYS
jgi:pSer/pThr/pTyr-binding forkhead associated (FHA) protein